MTNMTNTKPGVTETNDFGYYIQLKKQDVPVIFTGVNWGGSPPQVFTH